LEILEAIKRLNVDKAPSLNSILNRVLIYLPKTEITFLIKVFNTVLHKQYFPSAWKHYCMISILKQGKDPTIHFSYRPISLLDTVGKIFKKILLTMVLQEVNGRGFLHDEQFGF
jgi:hypothetical protein